MSNIIITVKNIQSLADVRIDLGQNTITEFTGDNSNGKSIICRFLEYLTNGDITHKDCRESLVNDKEDYGVFCIAYEKMLLQVILHRELGKSSITLCPDIYVETPKEIVRPLSDREGCNALLRKFGFRIYNKGSICLQLAPTWGQIPFITTNGDINHEIENDIIVDKVADNFIKSFSTITFPAFRNRVASMKQEIKSLQETIAIGSAYDYRDYVPVFEQMVEVIKMMGQYKVSSINKIKTPPKPINILKYVHIEHLHIPSKATLYKPHGLINKCSSELESLVTAINGVCPTCGTNLKDNTNL